MNEYHSCELCGTAWYGRKFYQKYCLECHKKNARKNKTRGHKARAIRYGVDYESIKANDIFIQLANLVNEEEWREWECAKLTGARQYA